MPESLPGRILAGGRGGRRVRRRRQCLPGVRRGRRGQRQGGPGRPGWTRSRRPLAGAGGAGAKEVTPSPGPRAAQAVDPGREDLVRRVVRARKIGRCVGPVPCGTSERERISLRGGFRGRSGASVASRLARKTSAVRSRLRLHLDELEAALDIARRGTWRSSAWSTGWTPRANSSARLTARAGGRSKMAGKSRDGSVAARMRRRSAGSTLVGPTAPGRLGDLGRRSGPRAGSRGRQRRRGLLVLDRLRAWHGPRAARADARTACSSSFASALSRRSGTSGPASGARRDRPAGNWVRLYR